MSAPVARSLPCGLVLTASELEASDHPLHLGDRTPAGKIEKVILAGMSANLCVEAHMRELLERGFEVAVVKDATAAAITPELNGYEAALTNFRFMANTIWTTAETVEKIEAAK